MTVTLGYFDGKETRVVALLAYANAKGKAAHPDRATHAWVCDGTRHADGVGFDELGDAYLVDRLDLR